MASSEQALLHTPDHPAHLAGEICPLCEQPIPPEKLAEIQQRERDRYAEQERKLRRRFAKDKADALAAKDAEIGRVTMAAAAESEKQAKTFEQKEKTIRADATAAAEAKGAKELKTLAEANAQLTGTVQQLRTDNKAAEETAEKRVAAARKKGKQEAETVAAAKLQKAEAERDIVTAELAKKDVAHAKEIKQQRKALEDANTTKLAEKDAEHFRERDKNLRTIQKLERSLERRTADERGEGSEINLYEALRDAFDDDKITRVGKGESGADIWHDVKYKGEVCGRIVYDAKDHGRWATSFAKKLRTDQLAAEAEHAILALAPTAFPSNSRQIELREGVILANPARVVALVTLLREQIIRSHRLSLSSHERDEKMVELYDFINSDRCGQLFSQFDSLMEKMEKLEVAEKKAHDKTWRSRGMLFKDVIKVVRGQLGDEIDRILEGSSHD